MAATDPRRSALRWKVRTAVATLLGFASTTNAAARTSLPPEEPVSSPERWTWDTSFMQYMEAERISVSEPQIGVRRHYGDNRALSILATVDTISGSTPLGTLPATANTAPATTTSPSGHPVNPIIGKVPLSHMSDTRVGLNATYERPRSPALMETIGAEVSKEHDFLSVGGSYSIDRDFNRKNTTLSLGLSPEFDIVTPNGGLPLAYATELTPGEFDGKNTTKYLVSGLFGVTQVISRRTLMQWNYTPTYENGYLNDPYKFLSLVNTGGDPLSAIHEKRPGYRVAHSFYWLTRHLMRERDVFSLGLRYYADSWGIHSQTIDFNYRWQYHERRFVEPRVRYYHQTAANFFHVGLIDGQPLPDFASADYRLNDIDGVTVGVAFGFTMKNESELILRADFYTQTGESKPNTAVGVQKNYDLFPTLHATILQVEYKFEPGKLWSKKKPY